MPVGAPQLHGRHHHRSGGDRAATDPHCLSEAILNYVLGVDIGGTNLVVAAVAVDGSGVLGDHSRPTGATRGPDSVVGDVVEMCLVAIESVAVADPAARVLGVGVGAPGPLDTTTGVVLLTPNLGWVDMPLRDRISAGVGVPVELENDANCAILGEAWVGAAKGARHAIGITIGTGIGGGIVIDGKLHHGASDSAGEIGHTTIDMDGRRCNCGNYGCLEAYASGPAIAMRAVELIEAGDHSILSTMVGDDLSLVTAATVYEAAHQGDELALDVVRKTAQYLGAGIANLMNIFNPDLVVIAGGVTQAGDRLFKPLRREVARRAFKPAIEAAEIVPGTLGDMAGVFGAARVFLDRRGPEDR